MLPAEGRDFLYELKRMRTILLLALKGHISDGVYHPSTRLPFTDKTELDKWLAEYRATHPGLRDEDIETGEILLREGEHLYKVYISDTDFVRETDAAILKARNERGARKGGMQYIRAWGLSGQRVVKTERIA